MTVTMKIPFTNDYVKAKVFVWGTIANPQIELEYKHDGMNHVRRVTVDQAEQLGITKYSQPFKILAACQV